MPAKRDDTFFGFSGLLHWFHQAYLGASYKTVNVSERVIIFLIYQ